MEGSFGRRRRSSPPSSCASPATVALIVTLVVTCTPAVATVNASYFAFADNGLYIDGDGDYSTTRSRAVVDSGFVHQPISAGFGLPLSDWTWHAKASADLASGALRVYAFSDTTDSSAAEAPPAAGHGWRTQAQANWSDAVTFVAPANAPAGVSIPITFKLDVRGSFAGFYASMTNTSFLMVNGTKSQVDFTWDGRLGPTGSIDAAVTTSGTVNGLSVEPRQLHGLLEVTVPVTPSIAISVIGSSLSKAAAGPYASATSDFDHTATLSIDLPAGYTYTSYSGVLLSVPEPSIWLSMLTGIALLAAVTARRRLRAPHRGHRRNPMPANRNRRLSAVFVAACGFASISRPLRERRFV